MKKSLLKKTQTQRGVDPITTGYVVDVALGSCRLQVYVPTATTWEEAFRVVKDGYITGIAEIESDAKRISRLCRELDASRALWLELLRAVYPKHSHWMDSNPELVQELEDLGYRFLDGTVEYDHEAKKTGIEVEPFVKRADELYSVDAKTGEVKLLECERCREREKLVDAMVEKIVRPAAELKHWVLCDSCEKRIPDKLEGDRYTCDECAIQSSKEEA